MHGRCPWPTRLTYLEGPWSCPPSALIHMLMRTHVVQAGPTCAECTGDASLLAGLLAGRLKPRTWPRPLVPRTKYCPAARDVRNGGGRGGPWGCRGCAERWRQQLRHLRLRSSHRFVGTCIGAARCGRAGSSTAIAHPVCTPTATGVAHRAARRLARLRRHGPRGCSLLCHLHPDGTSLGAIGVGSRCGSLGLARGLIRSCRRLTLPPFPPALSAPKCAPRRAGCRRVTHR